MKKAATVCSGGSDRIIGIFNLIHCTLLMLDMQGILEGLRLSINIYINIYIFLMYVFF